MQTRVAFSCQQGVHWVSVQSNMAHPRNRHQGKGKPDTSKVLVRVMSAMIGLSFGFAGGRFLAIPMAQAPVSGKAAAPAEAFSAPSMGAPLNERIGAAFRMNEDGLRGVLAGIQDEWVKTSSSPSREAEAMLDLRVLFSRWTDLDGDGALKAAIGIRDFQLSTLAIEAVMTEWGLRDSLAASQRVATIPSASGQQRGLAALVRAGVQKSPAEILTMTS